MLPMRCVEFHHRVGIFALGHGFVDEFGRRHVRLVHLHEIDVDVERLVRVLRGIIEKFQRCLFDVAVKEGNSNDAFLGSVDILAVDLEVLLGGFARVAGHGAFGHLVKERAQLFRHVREPGGIAVGVGVQVIEPAILHHVVALGIGQRVVGFAEMPLAGEVSFVSAGLEHRAQRPLRGGQPAALALEGHGGHAAAVGDAPGLHRGASRRAAWLGVKRPELHAVFRQAVNVGGGHAAPHAAAVGSEVTVAGIVRHDEEDVGFLVRRLSRVGGEEQRRRAGQQ